MNQKTKKYFPPQYAPFLQAYVVVDSEGIEHRFDERGEAEEFYNANTINQQQGD